MGDFRCPHYRWTGTHWLCAKINDWLDVYDYDTFCTDPNRYQDCPFYK